MSQFYAMLVHKDEPGFTTEPKGALFVCPARFSHIEDFGGTTKRIHIASGREVPASLALRNFNWTMSIDNPGASDQLKPGTDGWRSEEHTSELQSLMRISYAVCCLKKTKDNKTAYHVNKATVENN